MGFGGVEEMLREYSLSTKEGLALMVLAEALLRVPDAATADRLIEDKLGQGDFAHHEAKSDAFLVSASAWALGLTARIIQPGETPEGIIGHLAKRLGLPAVRTATRQAMRVLGNHFVLGQTIEEALERAALRHGQALPLLLRHARRGRAHRRRRRALFRLLRRRDRRDRPRRRQRAAAGPAGHLGQALGAASALRGGQPRARDARADAAGDRARARRPRRYDLNFTVDAEEADRLELSLDVIGAVFADPSLAGWDGFGLAIQAYQKRASAVIDWIAELARALDRRLMVRLVKGAYWDTEVKRAQERGLADYPVFTRKAMTDLNYERLRRAAAGACARASSRNSPRTTR